MFKIETLKRDIPASFVVFLVALPLSLGIALASGAPPESGLLAGIVGGIVVGLIGGAPLQVSGPAAGLTVLMYMQIQHFGFAQACGITVAAGLFQIAMSLAGASSLALSIAPAVLHAMLAGIGIIIMLAQTHVAMGLKPAGSALTNILELGNSWASKNNAAIITALASMFILVVWDRLIAKKLKSVPGALVAIIVGTLVSILLGQDQPHISLSKNILTGIQLPDWSAVLSQSGVLSALGLAVVASAESLLCAVATDKLHAGPRAKLGRELLGQGLGNVVSGLIGGLPITGVIVRSSANVSAGAVTKLSAVLHGVWILVFCLLFSGLLVKLPLASLAALLIFIGVKLVKIHEIKVVMKYREAIPYFATLFGVVFINLLWGIGIGFGIAIFFLLLDIARLEVAYSREDEWLVVRLRGSLSFLSVPNLMEMLGRIPPKQNVKLIFEVTHLDHAALDSIRSWRESYVRMGGKVEKQSLEQLWNGLRST